MRSTNGGRDGWSLTRRMAVLFSSTTCLVLALHVAWSAYTVVNAMRTDTKAFLEHETAELAQDLARSDGSPGAIQAAVDAIAAVTEDPPTSFRVRASDGRLLAEGGAKRPLKRVTTAIRVDGSWREHVPSQTIATQAAREPTHDLVVEVLVDMHGHLSTVRKYLISKAWAFLVTAAAVWVLGAFVARRGLRGLLQMAEQAERIHKAGSGQHIRVDDAPDEIRAVASALDSMIARIDAGSARMRTFTAGLAHELRSPIQNLMGETEVALMAERSPEQYRETLASNLDDLNDLSGAVDNLVAWCRTEDPRRVRGPAGSFDVAAESMLRLQRERRAAERAGVVLQLQADGDTTLAGDREACMRLVRNLVANAIDWSPLGGTVQVSIQGTEAGVEIAVTDEGPGVSEDLKRRMFEPFVSGEGKQRRSGRSGYGLGLAIVRSVVDDHGGRIDVESPEAGGTRFRAFLERKPG